MEYESQHFESCVDNSTSQVLCWNYVGRCRGSVVEFSVIFWFLLVGLTKRGADLFEESHGRARAMILDPSTPSNTLISSYHQLPAVEMHSELRRWSNRTFSRCTGVPWVYSTILHHFAPFQTNVLYIHVYGYCTGVQSLSRKASIRALATQLDWYRHDSSSYPGDAERYHEIPCEAFLWLESHRTLQKAAGICINIPDMRGELPRRI